MIDQGSAKITEKNEQMQIEINISSIVA